jgi:hypothetical protein
MANRSEKSMHLGRSDLKGCKDPAGIFEWHSADSGPVECVGQIQLPDVFRNQLTEFGDPDMIDPRGHTSPNDTADSSHPHASHFVDVLRTIGCRVVTSA